MPNDKKKNNTISFERQMNAVIHLNENAIVTEETDTYIKIKINLKLSFFAKLINLIYKVRDYKIYLLTDFNFRFYHLIKEKPRTVKELIVWLADLEKLSFLEARSLILDFVGNQMRRAIMVAEVPPPEEDEDNDSAENSDNLPAAMAK